MFCREQRVLSIRSMRHLASMWEGTFPHRTFPYLVQLVRTIANQMTPFILFCGTKVLGLGRPGFPFLYFP